MITLYAGCRAVSLPRRAGHASSAASWQARCCLTHVHHGAGETSTQPPAAVIFDLGKVLLDFDFSRAAAAISAKDPRVPAEVLLELFGHGATPPSPSEQSLVEQYERGALDTQGFFDAIAAASGLRCSLADFSRGYEAIFTPIPQMIAQQQLLRSAGIPTYILSNCSELHITHVREAYSFFSSFDGYILSYQERSYKPDKEIYVAAERLTGLQGSQLCFIDDKAENVVGAEELGWGCIHHQDMRQSLQAFAQLGLPTIQHSVAGEGAPPS